MPMGVPLRILSFNAGLLAWRGPTGTPLFENPPHVDKRSEYTGSSILATNADVVCLQECYEQRHFDKLVASLAATHPYHARVKSGGIIRFHNGLAVFSRYEIVALRLHQHHQAAWVETLLATKSMLEVEVEVPGAGKVTVVNMHLTAGLHPVSEAAVATRRRQIKEAMAVCDAARTSGSRVAFIAGDLNAGPEAAPENYEQLLEAGWRDAWVEANGSGGSSSSSGATWDPANALNSGGVHSDCAPQRCDHVFVSPGSSASVNVRAARITSTDAVAVAAGGKEITASDHYGIAADFTIHAPPPPSPAA